MVKKGLRYLLYLLAALLLAALFGMLWLGGSEQALRWGLDRAVSASDGRLQIEGVRGRALTGANIDRLQWHDGATRIEIAELSLVWRFRELLNQRIAISSVRAQTIDVALAESRADGSEAVVPAMPGDIGLVWPVLLGSLDVERLNLRLAEAAPLVFERLHAQGAHLPGEYRLKAFDVHTPWGTLNIEQASLGTAAPHRISARATLASDLRALGWQPVPDTTPVLTATASVEGDLRMLRLSAQARAGAAALRLSTSLDPLAGLLGIGESRLRLDAVDPSAWFAQAPAAQFAGELRLDSLATGRGSLRLINAVPGRLQDQALPVASLNADFVWDGERLAVDGIDARLFDGAAIAGSVGIMPGQAQRLAGVSLPGLDLNLVLSRFDPSVWVAGLRSLRIGGELVLSASRLQAQLRETPAPDQAALTGHVPLAVDARALLKAESIELEQIAIAHGRSRLSAGGAIRLAPELALNLSGRAEGFDPSDWFEFADPRAARWLKGRIDGRWTLAGEPAKAAWQIGLMLDPSQLNGTTLDGRVEASLAGKRLASVQARLRLGSNRLRAEGALGGPDDRLQWHAEIVEPSMIDAGLSGRIDGDGLLGWDAGRWLLDARILGKTLRYGDQVRAKRAELSLQWPFDPAAPLAAKISLDGIERDGLQIDRLRLNVDGTPQSHRFVLAMSAAAQQLDLSGQGAAEPDLSAWRAQFDSGRISGHDLAILRPGARLDVSGRQIAAHDWHLGLGADAQAGRFELDEFVWSLREAQTPLARSSGRVSQLPLARVLAWLDRVRGRPQAGAALEESITRLRLEADWQLSAASMEQLSGLLNARLDEVARADGGPALLGKDNRLRLKIDANRLDGQLELAMPSLVFARRYLGEDWHVDGRIELQAGIAGRIDKPVLRGQVTGTKLLLEQRSRGWRLDRGELQATFDADSLEIGRLRLHGDDGMVSLSGRARLLPDAERDRGSAERAPALPVRGEFQLDAERFRVPLDPGQRLVLSGRTVISSDGRALVWRGKLLADEGLIELRSAGAPVLPEDVLLVRRNAQPDAAPAAASSGVQLGADLEIDLGRNIRIVGGGVDAHLEGSVRLQGTLPDAPRVLGTVRVRDGVFQAYDQTLNVSSGAIRFNGPIDNPALDIVAVRTGLPVEAGVHLTGTALSPRVELISTPNVPDAEKLSWLVLGVPLDDAGTGAQSLALRQAASSLFGRDGGAMSGSLQQNLGLDVLSVGAGQATGQGEVIGGRLGGTGLPGASDSQNSAALREVVTVGKRLSSRLFVSYEQGLRGAWNLLRIQYDISQRLSLRAQTGSESAIDLLLFHWFD